METIHQSPSNPDAVIERWHIWRGTIRYFLVGPGPKAMHPCSEPDYANRRPVMTSREAALAKTALGLLEQRHRQDKEAGVAEIQLALADAARGVRPKTGRADHASSGETENRAELPPVKITRAMVDHVASIVGLVCKIPAHRLYQKATSESTLRAARILFIGCIRDLHPGIMQKDLIPILGMAAPSISNALFRHQYNLESFKDYRRQHAEIVRLAGVRPNRQAS